MIDKVVIKPEKPFDFGLMMDYLSRSTKECMHRIEDNKVMKLVELDGIRTIVSVEEIPKDRLLVQIKWSDSKQLNIGAVKSYVEEWFDTNTNIQKFYSTLGDDQILRPLIRQYQGLRIVGIVELFEAICWAIIGQQINLSFAYQVKRNFVRQCGEFVDWNNHRYYLFPRASTVKMISEQDWKKMKFSRQKARYISSIAEKMASGELSKENLLGKSVSEVKLELMSLIGIGEWSAEYILMRCFHLASAYPKTDAGLHQALRKILLLDRKPNLEELTKFGELWEPWQAYATFYLWRSLH